MDGFLDDFQVIGIFLLQGKPHPACSDTIGGVVFEGLA